MIKWNGNNLKLWLINFLSLFVLLEGTGLLVRMDQGRRVKKIFDTKSEGSRTGRPRMR